VAIRPVLTKRRRRACSKWFATFMGIILAIWPYPTGLVIGIDLLKHRWWSVAVLTAIVVWFEVVRWQAREAARRRDYRMAVWEARLYYEVKNLGQHRVWMQGEGRPGFPYDA
jgi:hypothetical protein